MKARAKIRLLLCPLVFLLCCRGERGEEAEREREHPASIPSRVVVQNGQTIINLTHDEQEKAGIAVQELQSSSHQEQTTAYGTVLGLDSVVDLYQQYSTARSDVEKSQAAVRASRAEYERSRALNQMDHNVSDKALQQSEAVWRSDQTAVEAAQMRVQTIQADIRQRCGPVLTQWIVESSPSLQRILQQRDVLLQITLPPGASIAAPQTIPVAGVSARLISPSLQTDPRIQGLSFFYVAPQPGTLLPGMNISVLLPATQLMEGVIVPKSAVVLSEGHGWCYIQKTATQFAKVSLSPGTQLDEGWFVTSQVKLGGKVVVRNAEMLLSEEYRSQIPVGEKD